MPPLLRWMGADVDTLHATIAMRATIDVGILENPPGSNRSPEIDAMMDLVGSPRGMSWCAAAVSSWFKFAGAEIPPTEAGAVRAWKAWAFRTSRWTTRAAIGRAVVYGDAQDNPEHIGVIIRVLPVMLSVEGNTSLQGYSTNGVACAEKAVTLTRVLGYISPTPLTGAEI
jgi:hypothetical protein